MLTEWHLAVMDSVLICTIGFLGDFQAMYILFLCISSTILKSKQTTKSNKQTKNQANKQTKNYTPQKLGMSFLSFLIGIWTLWEMHSFWAFQVCIYSWKAKTFLESPDALVVQTVISTAYKGFWTSKLLWNSQCS